MDLKRDALRVVSEERVRFHRPVIVPADMKVGQRIHFPGDPRVYRKDEHGGLRLERRGPRGKAAVKAAKRARQRARWRTA